MNEIVNKILLEGDKFMSEMHLRQSGFTYSAYGPKNKERIEKFRETGDLRHIYQRELDKTCFQHDMAYGVELLKRTFEEKVLRHTAINTAKDPKYDGYQRGLASMVDKCFDKKTLMLVVVLKMKILLIEN